MKEIDDTPLNESESEPPEWFLMWIATYFSERMNRIERRIADLETRKVIDAQRNEDEEWF